MKLALGITSAVLFGTTSYGVYKFVESERLAKLFEEIPDKKKYVLEKHQTVALSYDSNIEKFEKKNLIENYRKYLMAFAYGKILETGVGTSRNLPYYPKGSNVLGVDWSINMLEMANFKSPLGLTVNYALEDVEKLSFPDSTFDTVVDTFSLEYYLNPKAALNEMKRVCKPNGKILILTSGRSNSPYINFLLEYKKPYYLLNFGYNPARDWDQIITNRNFFIKLKGRGMNGTIYYYIIQNKKVGELNNKSAKDISVN